MRIRRTSRLVVFLLIVALATVAGDSSLTNRNTYPALDDHAALARNGVQIQLWVPSPSTTDGDIPNEILTEDRFYSGNAGCPTLKTKVSHPAIQGQWVRIFVMTIYQSNSNFV